MTYIYMIENNVHGGYTVYGVLGVRQFYGYTKSECKQMYMEQCKGKLFFNVK